MPTRHGAFLDDIWGFDNTFFNISPREAKSMDPQQRILLSTTQKALEDAGYVGDATPSFQKASMGCYIGLATGDYTDNLRDDIDVFYSPGKVSSCLRWLSKLSNRHLMTRHFESVPQRQNILFPQAERSCSHHRYSLLFVRCIDLSSLSSNSER